MHLWFTALLIISFQERFGVPYSYSSTRKAVQPTNYSPSKGRESQSVDMAPIYLGHECGLVSKSGSVYHTERGECHCGESFTHSDDSILTTFL